MLLDTETPLARVFEDLAIKRWQLSRTASQVGQRLFHSADSVLEVELLIVLIIKLLLADAALVLEQSLGKSMILSLDSFIFAAAY